MAVATTAKSRNMEPPKIAMPAKSGISAIPFLLPVNASAKPMRMAMATPGILLRKSFLEIKNENSITKPTKRKANMSPFLAMTLSMISMLSF